jgi:hypothetical protein
MLARGATTSKFFRFPPSVDFSKITQMEVFVAGLRSGKVIQKNMNDLLILTEERKVRLYLSIEETLQFYDDEEIEIQFRVSEGSELVRTSKVIPTTMYRFIGGSVL